MACSWQSSFIYNQPHPRPFRGSSQHHNFPPSVQLITPGLELLQCGLCVRPLLLRMLQRGVQLRDLSPQSHCFCLGVPQQRLQLDGHRTSCASCLVNQRSQLGAQPLHLCTDQRRQHHQRCDPQQNTLRFFQSYDVKQGRVIERQMKQIFVVRSVAELCQQLLQSNDARAASTCNDACLSHTPSPHHAAAASQCPGLPCGLQVHLAAQPHALSLLQHLKPVPGCHRSAGRRSDPRTV